MSHSRPPVCLASADIGHVMDSGNVNKMQSKWTRAAIYEKMKFVRATDAVTCRYDRRLNVYHVVIRVVLIKIVGCFVLKHQH